MVGILFWLMVIAFGVLGVHHFIKARRGERTGVVEALMLGYGRRTYSRADDPAAFRANVSAGYCAAIVGAMFLLWGCIAIAIRVLISHGFDQWP